MTNQNASPVQSRSVSLKELEPIIRETLEAGGCVKLPVTGTSNLPTLAPDRDQVTLQKAEGPLVKGDLPLYKRDSGQFVLHRIVSVQKDGSLCCCGDHQWKKEAGIRPDQVLGLVTQIRRKGRAFSTENIGYRLWVRLWVFLLPCRWFLVRVYHLFGRFRRLFVRNRPRPREK